MNEHLTGGIPERSGTPEEHERPAAGDEDVVGFGREPASGSGLLKLPPPMPLTMPPNPFDPQPEPWHRLDPIPESWKQPVESGTGPIGL